MINNSGILLRNNGSKKTVESPIEQEVYNQWKYPEKASFKNKGEIKTIPDFKKWVCCERTRITRNAKIDATGERW